MLDITDEMDQVYESWCIGRITFLKIKGLNMALPLFYVLHQLDHRNLEPAAAQISAVIYGHPVVR